MATEKKTENILLKEMGELTIGRNGVCDVFDQGDLEGKNEEIFRLLKMAGGKPEEESLNELKRNLSQGFGKPDYIITYKNDKNTILVIECKKNIKDHSSKYLNKPKKYAVDGALYYAKYLSKKFNVIAIAFSGIDIKRSKVSTFKWYKGSSSPEEIKKIRNSVIKVENYLKIFKGEEMKVKYSKEEILECAISIHERLRTIKMSEKYKPLFIAGVLIALQDSDFINDYSNISSFQNLSSLLIKSIEKVLLKSDIKLDKKKMIIDSFKSFLNNEKLKEISQGQDGSLNWYIKELDLKIRPMMHYYEETIDVLGIFYQEFIKYSGGKDGNALGIILTPTHIAEFMAKCIGIHKNDKVVDAACGSGSFLVSAMKEMFRDATPDEIKKIKNEGIYGVELDPELFTLSITNMIIRGDGKSNILQGDCFSKKIKNELGAKNLTVGLLNPPYSQNDFCELEFVENMLELLCVGGRLATIVPVSCAIGTKYRDIRERLFSKNTLEAVFTMPEEVFYPVGVNVCVMIWSAHKPHNYNNSTFLARYKDDGFEKRKKLGRVDIDGKWEHIQKEWVDTYHERKVIKNVSLLKNLKHTDEWLAEAYLETDYSDLDIKDFQYKINEYVGFLVKEGEI